VHERRVSINVNSKSSSSSKRARELPLIIIVIVVIAHRVYNVDDRSCIRGEVTSVFYHRRSFIFSPFLLLRSPIFILFFLLAFWKQHTKLRQTTSESSRRNESKSGREREKIQYIAIHSA
jgi:hypothetical protein